MLLYLQPSSVIRYALLHCHAGTQPVLASGAGARLTAVHLELPEIDRNFS